MFNLVKKDFVTLSKSKSDLLELLFMPFFLIAILGFTLEGIILNDFSINTFTIGVVNEQNLPADLDRFETRLLEQGVPQETAEQILASAQETDPAQLLFSLLEDDSFEDIFIVEEIADEASAEAALAQDDLAGYITIPEGFSYDVWQAVYFDAEEPAPLGVAVQVGGTISAGMLQGVVSSFVEQYNLETSIALATDGQAAPAETASEHGEVRQLSVEEPVTAFQYYTIGMGVMFALSTAPALANRAYKEKEEHVFGRIMLSGTRPSVYLGSKMVSGTLVTFVQLVILFFLSTLIFGTFKGREMNFWIDMIVTTSLYSLLIGGFTALLTSTSLYADNNRSVNFFGSFTMVFAFLGGSFTPVEQFSESLKDVGNWTPNGAAMTSYLQLMQGFDFQEVLPLMARVIGMTVLSIVVAVIIFPKRRLD